MPAESDVFTIERANHLLRRVSIEISRLVEDERGCWVLDGSMAERPRIRSYSYSSSGPGYSQHQLLSRWLFEEATGISLRPSGDYLRSTCGNLRCVNPDHWSYSPPQEEVGKRGVKRGLSAEDQRRIFEDKAAGMLTRELASKYGISPSTVRQVVNFTGSYQWLKRDLIQSGKLQPGS